MTIQDKSNRAIAAQPADPSRTVNIPSLTVLRGLLAVWVVVHHFWKPTLEWFPWLEALSPVVHRGNMAVLGFFVLSGSVIAYNYSSWFPSPAVNPRAWSLFVAQRLARIYPVHLATLVAVAAMVLLSRRAGVELREGAYGSWDFLQNLALVHAWGPVQKMSWNYPSWSISAEWVVYMAFPFVAGLTQRWITNGLRAAAAAGCFLVLTVVHLQFWPFAPFQAILLVVPNFLLGVAIHRMVLLGPSTRVWRYLPDGLLLLCLGACYLPSVALSTLVLSSVPAFLVLALLHLKEGVSGLWRNPVLVFLGEISYSLYLMHSVVEKPLSKLLSPERFLSWGALGRASAGIVQFAVVLGAGWLCYALVERPMRRSLGRRLKSLASARP